MSTAAATIGALSFLVCVGAVGQGNMAFLKNSPVAYLTTDDVKLLREALAVVLDSNAPNGDQTWRNAATGSSGRVKMLLHFNTQDNRECRRLRIETHTTKGGDGAFITSVCRSPGDQWKTDADAQPAPAAK
jgi:surface antigen